MASSMSLTRFSTLIRAPSPSPLVVVHLLLLDHRLLGETLLNDVDVNFDVEDGDTTTTTTTPRIRCCWCLMRRWQSTSYRSGVGDLACRDLMWAFISNDHADSTNLTKVNMLRELELLPKQLSKLFWTVLNLEGYISQVEKQTWQLVKIVETDFSFQPIYCLYLKYMTPLIFRIMFNYSSYFF